MFAVVAVATTIAMHLRTLLSVGIGTAVYVTLVNLL